MRKKSAAKKEKAAGKKPPAEDRPKGIEMDFKIDDLTPEPDFQPRLGDGKSGHGIYEDHVNDLRAAVRRHEPLPRVRVWRIAGKGNYLTGGHHTTEAYKAEGRKTVPAEVFEGTWLDAVKDATSSNLHEAAPLKLTYEEKRNAVKVLAKALATAGEVWSNGKMAKHIHVSDDLVATVIKKEGIAKPAGPVKGIDGKNYAGPPKRKPAVPKPADEPSLGSSFEPKEAGGSGPPPSAATPTALTATSDHTNQPPSLTFDFAAFEGRVGAIDRDIDRLGEMFKVKNTPRTEGIRRALRDFKAAFTEWHKELGEKARVKG